MKTIIRHIKKIYTKYNNMMIMKKYLITFSILVVIPTVILSINYFLNINKSLYTEYKNKQEKVIQSSLNNMNDYIQTIESVNKYFQSSNILINYLSGHYEKDADVITYYNNDIYNLFSYIGVTNDSISDMILYSYNTDILLIPPYIQPMNKFNYGDYVKYIKPTKGVWITEDINNSTSLFYNTKYYDENYHHELGILSIKIELETLFSTMNKDIYDYIILQTPGGNYKYDGSIIEKQDAYTINEFNKSYENDSKKIMVKYSLPKFLGDIYVVSRYNLDNIYHRNELFKAILFILLLCLILGSFYYITYKTIVKRLRVFKNHISSMKDERIIPMDEIKPMDEVGFLMLSFNQFADRINNLISKVYREEILKKEAMYYALEAQINPHFLYNTLEGIRMIAEENCDFDVSDQLYLLGSILRYTLSKNQDSTVIADEINYTIKYLKLFKNRNKGNFKYNIETDITNDQITIPKYIIQPLIENSIKHGFANKLDTCEIDIQITDDDSYVYIMVSDNGIGMEESKVVDMNKKLLETKSDEVLKYESGIGLFNVNDRIKLFNNNNSGLIIWINKKGGLSVQAKIKI